MSSSGYFQPVFILNSPRSGSSYLFEILRRHPELWTLGRETTPIWNRLFPPEERDFLLTLTAKEAQTNSVGQTLIRSFQTQLHSGGDTHRACSPGFLQHMHDQGINPYYYDLPEDVVKLHVPHANLPVGPPGLEHKEETLFVLPSFDDVIPTERWDAGVTFLDKTPSNCYRVGFLNEVFPTAKYIFLLRDPRGCISSLIEAWKHPRAFFLYDMDKVGVELNIGGYSDVYSWGRSHWKLEPPPNWRTLVNKRLAEVCAEQWQQSIASVLAFCSQEKLDGRVLFVRYEDLVDYPQRTVTDVLDFIGLKYHKNIQMALQESPHVMSTSAPLKDKWKYVNYDEVVQVTKSVADMAAAIGYDIN